MIPVEWWWRTVTYDILLLMMTSDDDVVIGRLSDSILCQYNCEPTIQWPF